MFIFFFSSRRRHTRFDCDWSSDVCSSDLSYFRALTGANWNNGAIAAIALLTLTGVNCFGARAGSNVQNALMLLKIGAIAALVIIGFAFGQPVAAGLRSASLFGQPASFGLLKSIGAAMVPIAFAYGGWQTATFVAGEMRDARRDLSRGLVIGVGGFFFQAEDGIRDLTVTGVQTCALPI